MADSHANFAYSSVATAPSPSTTGTSLTVVTGEGARFPTAPYNVAIWPAGVAPLSTNAEIARVTSRSGDVLTIIRASEGPTSARAVVVGDQICAAITNKTLTDIEALKYVLAFLNVTQAISNNSITPIILNSEDYDVGSLHDVAVNNTRVTITVAGLYLVVGRIYYAALTATDIRARIHKNGVIVGAETVVQNSAAPVTVSITQTLILAVGDYLELAGYQNSGGSINSGSATRQNANELSVTQLK